MMKVLIDDKLKGFILNEDKKYNIDFCSVNDILSSVDNNNYDALFLTKEYNNILFNVRHINKHHCSYIVLLDNENTFSLFSDYLINDILSKESFDEGFRSIEEFLFQNSRAKISNSLKRMLVQVDSDLETQLYRVPILTKFIIDCLIEENVSPLLNDEEFIKETIYFSSIHDFGKMAIEDEILNYTGKFNDYQFEIMKKHTTLGRELYDSLSNIFPVIKSERASNIIHYHHEKFDGSGYPTGIKGESIPFEARIVAVADVYDAVRSNRKYKDGVGHSETFNILLDGKGTHFDPNIIRVLQNNEKELESLYNKLI